MRLSAAVPVLALVAAGPTLVACEPDRAVATVLLATDSGHWGDVDLPALRQRVTATCRGCDVEVRLAAGDPAEQERQFDAALEAGSDVVVVEPVDPVAAEDLVTRAGDVPVIAWSDVVAGADHYVGPEPGQVGRLLGQQAVRSLPRGRGAAAPRVLVVTDAGTDPAVATLLDTATSLLPDGVGIDEVAAADAGEATREVSSSLGRTAYAVVLAGTDDLTAGASRALQGRAQAPALLGPGADLDTARRIVAGDQAMSVHEPYEPMAAQVADVVVSLLTGGEPTGGVERDGTRSWEFESRPVVLETLTSTMVRDRAIDLDDLCAGELRARCTRLGLL